MPDITCVSCGVTHRTKFKKQRYCSACQVLRDLANGLLANKCPSCARVYWPIRYTHTLCPSCTLDNGKQHTTCTTCGETRRGAPGLTDTCLFCVTETRKARDKYRAALRVLTGRRRRDLADPPPQPIE